LLLLVKSSRKHPNKSLKTLNATHQSTHICTYKCLCSPLNTF